MTLKLAGHLMKPAQSFRYHQYRQDHQEQLLYTVEGMFPMFVDLVVAQLLVFYYMNPLHPRAAENNQMIFYRPLIVS